MITKFTITPSVWVLDSTGKEQVVASFIDPLAINTVKKEFMITREDLSEKSLSRLLNMTPLRTSENIKFFSGCAVKACNNKDIEMHHIRKLNRRYKGNLVSVKVRSKQKDITKTEALLSALRRKQIPLCKYHHQKIHSVGIGKEEIEDEYLYKKTVLLRKDGSVLAE